MQNKTRKIKWIVIGLVVSWLLFTFMIYPNLNLFRITLFPEGSFDIQPLINILSSERVRTALLNSFILGVLVAITTNIVGIFQILALDYFRIPGRKWLGIVYYLPLIINGMVLVMAYNFLIGTNGIFTTQFQNLFPNLPNEWMLGLPAVLLQLTFSNTMFHITFVRDSLKNLDYQTVEAARNMGASTGSILRKVVLPTLTPSILAATILNFSMAMNSFASPQVLGGSDFETITPLVYTFSQSQNTRNYAVILSVLLGIVTFIILILFTQIERRKNVISVSKVKTKVQRQKIENPFYRMLATFFAHLIGLIQIIPAIFVIIFSFMSYEDLMAGQITLGNFSLENYTQVFSSSSGLQPVIVSLMYAAAGAIISVIIILIFARWITKYKNKLMGFLESILMIPWFVPATLLALGLLFTFNTSQNPLLFNQVLTGTIWLVLIGYVILRLPTNLRILKSSYLSIDNSLEDAAKNLGAGTVKTYFKVIFPILLPTVLSTVLLSFIFLLAEYDLTVFLFHTLYTPLGVVINNATSAEAGASVVMLSFVYSVIIMIISTIATYLVYGRPRKKNKKMK